MNEKKNQQWEAQTGDDLFRSNCQFTGAEHNTSKVESTMMLQKRDQHGQE